MTAAQQVPRNEPGRRLGLGASVALLLGNMVGVGIFLTPPEVAAATPGWASYLGLWALGGLMAAAGAQVFAELGILFPRAGGDYVFLDRAFGRPVAVSWGLLSVLGSFPGSIAALAIGAARTLQGTRSGAWLVTPLVQVGSWTLAGQEILALGVIAGVTLWNARGVPLASRIQQVLAWIPFAGFGGMALWALGLAVARVAGAGEAPSIPDPPPSSQGTVPSLGALASAACGVFFTFSGWNVLTYVGGEVRRPHRTIPRAVVLSVSLVVGLYLVLNLAFLLTLSLEGLRGTGNAGVATARVLMGETGAEAFALAMFLVILAGLNSTVMAGSRIAMAVGADGYLWPRLAEIHPVRETPAKALGAQAALAAALVLTGSFSFLITLTGAVMILLSCVTVATLFVFRRRQGLRPPVRLPGYPWTAAFFLAGGILVLLVGMLSGGPWSLLGFAVPAALVAALRLGNGGRPQNPSPEQEAP